MGPKSTECLMGHCTGLFFFFYRIGDTTRQSLLHLGVRVQEYHLHSPLPVPRRGRPAAGSLLLRGNLPWEGHELEECQKGSFYTSLSTHLGTFLYYSDSRASTRRHQGADLKVTLTQFCVPCVILIPVLSGGLLKREFQVQKYQNKLLSLTNTLWKMYIRKCSWM